MRNLFLLSLFMMASLGGQTPMQTSFIASAYAEEGTAEFHCPKGVTTCYKAYSEGEDTDSNGKYTDINNLPATAAGPEGEGDDGESLVTVVKPKHFRSF